jgi:hypothetical protein
MLQGSNELLSAALKSAEGISVQSRYTVPGGRNETKTHFKEEGLLTHRPCCDIPVNPPWIKGRGK